MMRCYIGIVLLTLYATTSNTLPYELAQNMATVDMPLTMGDTEVQTQLLTFKPNLTKQSTDSDEIKSRTAVDDTAEKATAQDDNKITKPEDVEESDYSTLVDRVSDAEDEDLDIDGDATPLNFLKQREVKRRAKVPPIVSTTNNGGGSAIYITVPIYVNTAGGMPLTLNVGGQNIPLGDVNPQVTKQESPREIEPPAKTSQFNRLPHYNEAQAQSPVMPKRLINRHRSNLHGRSYARKQVKRTPEKFRKIGTYSFYF